MDLSILIVSWNTRELLAQCLESVYANPPTGEFEIIVVDNASVDGSVGMVRERFPQVILIENSENVGFARANNQAICNSQGEYVLLLNSDVIALPATFELLLELMGANPSAGAAGPILLNPDGSFQASYNDFPTLLREGLALIGPIKRRWEPYYPSHRPEVSRRTRTADWMGGACLIVRRTCIDQIGLLDQRTHMYGEEVDWCYRMKQAGWSTVYCADAAVIHLGGGSSTAYSVSRHMAIQRGKVYFFRKHRSRGAARTMVGMVRVTNLAKALAMVPAMKLRPDASQVRARFVAYWAAVREPLQYP